MRSNVAAGIEGYCNCTRPARRPALRQVPRSTDVREDTLDSARERTKPPRCNAATHPAGATRALDPNRVQAVPA